MKELIQLAKFKTRLRIRRGVEFQFIFHKSLEIIFEFCGGRVTVVFLLRRGVFFPSSYPQFGTDVSVSPPEQIVLIVTPTPCRVRERAHCVNFRTPFLTPKPLATG